MIVYYFTIVLVFIVVYNPIKFNFFFHVIKHKLFISGFGGGRGRGGGDRGGDRDGGAGRGRR